MSNQSRLPTDPTSRADKVGKSISRAEIIWIVVILGLGVFIGVVLLTKIDVNNPRNAQPAQEADVDEWPGRNDFKSTAKTKTGE